MSALIVPLDLVERDFTATAPNRLWVADFTYVATWSGVVYVAFVIDAFSRRIVGWKADTNMRTDLVLDTLEMALWTRDRAGLPVGRGLIHHHDNGSQYLSFAFTQRLIDAGVDASVGCVGDAYDNALAEIHHRPVQDREDPPRRTLEDARRRRAGNAGMGRLVQHHPTAFCLRQTLPSAVRAQVSRSTSNPIATVSNGPGAVQKRGRAGDRYRRVRRRHRHPRPAGSRTATSCALAAALWATLGEARPSGYC